MLLGTGKLQTGHASTKTATCVFTIFRLLSVHKQRISTPLFGDDFAYLHFQRLQILHCDLFDRYPRFDLQVQLCQLKEKTESG